MAKDLTVGKPFSALWKFCLPLFGSIIFQQLYNLADSFVAGRFGGESALAAVGNGYEITLIAIAIAMGCNIGGSVVAARHFGAKRYEQMKTSVYTTLIGSGVLCLLLTALGLAFCLPLLTLIQTPTELLADSSLYLNVYLIGFPFVMLYNVSSGIFAGLGDSKTPFYFLMASSLANIALDFAFALLMPSSVVLAVALATLVCQGISGTVCVVVLIFKLKAVPTQGKVPVFSAQALKEVAVVAIPSMLQQSFVSVGNIIIQGVINGFGQAVIAGYAASIKLNNLVITSLVTLGNGVSNFTSQNLGAQKPERVKVGFWSGLALLWTICVPFLIVYCIFGGALVRVFINDPTDLAVLTGQQFLWIVTPFYVVISCKLVADGVLRGAKKMAAFVISTFTDLILRVVLAIVLSVPFGAMGIWMAWPVGWIVSTVISVVLYATGIWKK